MLAFKKNIEHAGKGENLSSNIDTTIYEQYNALCSDILTILKDYKTLSITEEKNVLRVSTIGQYGGFEYSISVPTQTGSILGIYTLFKIPFFFEGGILFKPSEISESYSTILDCFNLFIDSYNIRHELTRRVILDNCKIEHDKLKEGSNTINTGSVKGNYPYYYYQDNGHVDVFIGSLTQFGYSHIVNVVELVATGIYIGHVKDLGCKPEDVNWTLLYDSQESLVLSRISLKQELGEKGFIIKKKTFKQYTNPTFDNKKLPRINIFNIWWNLTDTSQEVKKIIKNPYINNMQTYLQYEKERNSN